MQADGRQPTPNDTQKIACLFKEATKPLYLGYVSLQVGLPLSKAKFAADELLRTGVIRRLTVLELCANDCRSDDEVYVAVS